MNPAIGKPFIGTVGGKLVSGIIERVAEYTKGSVPISYAVRPYRGEGQRCSIVPAADVAAHVDGLALVASMEGDKE